ncbi:unnamed protein product [uncultured bacterium]|nr:unnamed protein product [uncultured bacterium]
MGSLRIHGGAYTAASQPSFSINWKTNLSISVRLRINRSTSGGSTLFDAACLFVVDQGNGNLTFYLFDEHGTIFSGGFQASIGAVVTLLLSWNAAGTSRWFADGYEVASTVNASKVGLFTNSVISLGSTTGDANYDVELADLRIWSNVSLTPADALNLRDGVAVAAVPDIIWTLAGTSGVAPAAGDGSVNSTGSYTGAGSGLDTFTGSTGLYTSNALVYAANSYATGYVSKCGKLIFWLARNSALTIPSGGGTVSVPSVLQTVTAVDGAPTVQWNGRALTLYGTVGSIPVIGGGTGYTAASANIVGDGIGSNASAVLSGGAVRSISIINRATLGIGYSAAGTSANITGPGTGAVLGAPVITPVWDATWNAAPPATTYGMPLCFYQVCCGGGESVRMYTHGHGYTSGSVHVSASGGGGSGMTFGAPVIKNGSITSWPVTSGGSYGYGHGVPSLAASGGGGSGAILRPWMRNYDPNTGRPAQLVKVHVIDGGSGYTAAGMTIALGPYWTTPPTFGPPVIEDGVIWDIPISGPGSGYVSQPDLLITDTGSGTGASGAILMGGIAPSDTLTWGAPVNWMTTQAGSVDATANATLANFAGQDENVISYDYTLPNGNTAHFAAMAPTTHTLKAGTGPSGGSNVYASHYSPQANWIHRSQWFATPVGGSGNTNTSDGFPVNLGTGGAVNQLVLGSFADNFIDSRSFPPPLGTWTLTWDDSNVATPTDLSLALQDGSQAPNLAINQTGSSPGTPTPTPTPTAIVGRSKTYTMSIPGTSTYSAPQTVVTYTNATTRTNTAIRGSVYLTPPGNTVDRTKPYKPEANLLARMTSAGGKGLAMIRTMKDTNTEFSNVIMPADLLRPTDHSWSDYPTRQIAISQVRAVSKSMSPWVYLSERYGVGGSLGSGLTAPGGSPGPYRVPLDDLGKFFYARSGWGLFEVVTAIPHGFLTGHQVNIVGSVPVAFTNGSASAAGLADNLNGGGVYPACFVTGPNTAIGLRYTGSAAANSSLEDSCNNIKVPYNYASGAQPYLELFQPSRAWTPIEMWCGVVNALQPGSALLVPMWPCGTDDAVRAYARRIRDAIDPTHPVYVEYGNETWNDFYPHTRWMYFTALLMPGFVDHAAAYVGPNTAEGFAAQRSCEVFNVFKAAFNEADLHGVTGRGDLQVRHALGAWTDGEANTRGRLSQCVAASTQVDTILVAPYIDAQPWFYYPFACTVSGQKSSAGFGVKHPWTYDMYLDVWKHFMLLWSKYSAPQGARDQGHFANQQQAISDIMHNNTTTITYYEGGAEYLVPVNISPDPGGFDVAYDGNLTTCGAHDLFYHPRYADVVRAWHLAGQNAGVEWTCYFQHMSFLYYNGATIDGNGIMAWALSSFPQQPYGHGDGSSGSNLNQYTLIKNTAGLGGDGVSHLFNNDAPGLRSLLDWVDASPALPTTGSPTPTPTPTPTPIPTPTPTPTPAGTNVSVRGGGSSTTLAVSGTNILVG